MITLIGISYFIYEHIFSKNKIKSGPFILGFVRKAVPNRRSQFSCTDPIKKTTKKNFPVLGFESKFNIRYELPMCYNRFHVILIITNSIKPKIPSKGAKP